MSATEDLEAAADKLLKADYERALTDGRVPMVGRRRMSYQRWAYVMLGIAISRDHGWDRRGTDARGRPRKHAVPLSLAFANGEREVVKVA